MKTIFRAAALLIIALVAYLALWPVPVQPVAWTAPENPGYTGPYALNTRLAALERIDIGPDTGPEDAAIGPDGLIYVATHEGNILRLPPEGPAEVFASTGGRPLGIEFGPDGTLYVADAYLGLLAAAPDGTVSTLASQTTDGSPILYADDVDIGPDGAVYFSDASTRFAAKDHGTLAASVLDLIEHSANGRILKYDPGSGETTVFADGLTFANGVAVDAASQSLLVVETGDYRVWRYPLTGGPGRVILDALPGFPDNINPGPDGSFWVGLVSPRNDMMDGLSSNVFLRSMIVRLPDAMKPAPTRHGFLIRMDADGNVLETLQDPSGAYALTTGAVTLPDGRTVVSSLSEPDLAILPAGG
ncbi:MAG: SMP-30/gluconolactonase/LRE family protein [Pseudomonadota bacterium]